MCEDCLLIDILPEHVDAVVDMIKVSGICHGVTSEKIETKCQLFRITRCAYYVPPNVKSLLLSLSDLGIPIFDWRQN